ncbi:hypothetical protein T4D_7824 [Trichinella pseudospiralis]|uniref:Uncharacterized protein n=1 Tax=Trichinella pseudospiralis TaxID=6337 RepID=A0A0V1DN17_TRIPS|nr:hypothetical protein T4D_7824 [Trichinella pseudospiralis]
MLNVKSNTYSLYHISKLANQTNKFEIKEQLTNALIELRECFTTLSLAT